MQPAFHPRRGIDARMGDTTRRHASLFAWCAACAGRVMCLPWPGHELDVALLFADSTRVHVHLSSSRFKYPPQLVAIFVSYFYAAQFGLRFDAINGFASLVWPPAGIGLASFFLF